PPPRVPVKFSPPAHTLQLLHRSPSGLSNGSSTLDTSPTDIARRRRPIPKSPHRCTPSEDNSGGRFERDFVEVNEVGRGEFGRVIKARWKHGGEDGEVFAIKKS